MQKINDEINPHFEQIEERKKKTLRKLDNAKFGWFHLKTIPVVGIGFFSVS